MRFRSQLIIWERYQRVLETRLRKPVEHLSLRFVTRCFIPQTVRQTRGFISRSLEWSINQSLRTFWRGTLLQHDRLWKRSFKSPGVEETQTSLNIALTETDSLTVRETFQCQGIRLDEVLEAVEAVSLFHE